MSPKRKKQKKDSPERFKLNIGGTKYEVSDSLLEQFPDSILRRITSDSWNEKNQDDADTDNDDSSEDPEIFIERNGSRFQFVLDYMRDGKVALPMSIPRAQLIADMEYFGIDFEDSSITISVTDPKDLFQIGRAHV